MCGMKNSVITKLFSGFLVFAVFSGMIGLAAADEDSAQNNLPARKIVVFKKGASEFDKSDALRRAGGSLIKKLRQRDMAAVALDEDSAAALSKDARVLRIEDDAVVEALETVGGNNKQAKTNGNKPPSQPAEVLPWGINKIDAEQVWLLGGVGAGVNVGVIDTGISSVHPDLIANIKGGVSEVWYTSSWNDDNGHGSHVAGIIGAVDNSIGVIGASHSANLYAIKVLDRRGSGYLSDVIDGVDWAIGNGMNVINLSLGCDCPSQFLHDAVARARDAGIVVVAAAGNSGGSVLYPAAYPEAIAVVAVDSSDTAPYWSSRGPEVDLAAPGKSIYSTYKGTGYATLSGTSMAAPHVAGATALMLGAPVDPAYDADASGTWNPDEVQNKLQATATDLGIGGIDDIYGYGLVNALAAFIQ